MKITLASVFVDDQDKALAFYTEKLGFVLAADIPMGTTAGSRSPRRKLRTARSWH